MRPDVVIRNGLVFADAGSEPLATDLAIVGNRIAGIGPDLPEGETELDAGGCYVTPGFIDIHSHSDFTLLVDPRAMSAIYQGVTCEVIGNCGFGCFPVRDPALAAGSIYGFSKAQPLTWSTTEGYFSRLEAAAPAVNVLSLVPNAQLRLSVLGMADRAATADERKDMAYLLDRSLEEGAWGFSTGLEYPAESGASKEELSELCACVARRGGVYATHTRDRDARSAEAVKEALETAESSGVRLQVSHLLPRNGLDAGRACIELVEKARAGDQDVAFDMHTRLHGTTYLAAALPAWARAGTPRDIAERLASPAMRERMRSYRSIVSGGGDWSRIILLDNTRWPHYARRSLAEIASERGQDPFDTIFDLLAGVVDDLSGLMVLIAAYSEEQQNEAFAHPMCMPASDATTLATDGPLAGSAFHGAYTWAAWFFRAMVRERKVLTPQEAVYKLTAQPAGILGLKGRGTLKKGAFADIAIFVPEEFGERGTLFEPSQLAAGMRHVIVNGKITLRDGNLTGQRGGQVLRFSG